MKKLLIILGIVFMVFFSSIEYSAASTAVSIPEPATMLLLGTGLIGLAVLSRKKFMK